MFGKPKMQAPPAASSQALPNEPREDSPEVKQAIADQRRRANRARGYSSTIATSPRGVMGGDQGSGVASATGTVKSLGGA